MTGKQVIIACGALLALSAVMLAGAWMFWLRPDVAVGGPPMAVPSRALPPAETRVECLQVPPPSTVDVAIVARDDRSSPAYRAATLRLACAALREQQR